MDLYVVGCHGGETPNHRASAFVLDSIIGIDAGSVTRGLSLEDQARLEVCLVSHSHLDHVRDLATLADNRCQMTCKPLIVAGTAPTLASLKRHFFNNELWPDFTAISTSNGPVIQFVELDLEKPVELAGKRVRAVAVTHTIDTSGFIIEGDSGAFAYSGDTGPTDRFWEVLSETPNLKALLMEVSFPDRESGLAKVSGHHTPTSLAEDLRKLTTSPPSKNGSPRKGLAPDSLPTVLYHIKPVFQREVEIECSRLPGLSLEVAQLDDHFQF
jgi:3',5'-cyclic-nucleotide phosphodiesterase